MRAIDALKITLALELPGCLTLDSDKNPENWRTINGSHVHLDEHGRIDGGAGGKFHGQPWKGKTSHGSERKERINRRIAKMNLSQRGEELLRKGIEAYKSEQMEYDEEIFDREDRIKHMRKELETLRESARGKSMIASIRASIEEQEEDLRYREKALAQYRQRRKDLPLRKYVNPADFDGTDREEVESFLYDFDAGGFDEPQRKGGTMLSLFGKQTPKRVQATSQREQSNYEKYLENKERKKNATLEEYARRVSALEQARKAEEQSKKEAKKKRRKTKKTTKPDYDDDEPTEIIPF